LIALPESFYARDTVTVARALLGKTLLYGALGARIVEVEAYLGAEDLAAHASRGLTPRTRVLFGPPGRAYVYLSYGIHECLNVVAEPAGIPGCVLLRALTPLSPNPRRLDGPGRLTRALGIDRRLYGHTLWEPPLQILDAPPPPEPILVTPRIGITRCADWPLRFLLAPGP
jgi:DNA-3-methyladenine glycosylase